MKNKFIIQLIGGIILGGTVHGTGDSSSSSSIGDPESNTGSSSSSSSSFRPGSPTPDEPQAKIKFMEKILGNRPEGFRKILKPTPDELQAQKKALMTPGEINFNRSRKQMRNVPPPLFKIDTKPNSSSSFSSSFSASSSSSSSFSSEVDDAGKQFTLDCTITGACADLILYALPPYTGPKSLLILLQKLLDGTVLTEVIEQIIRENIRGGGNLAQIVYIYDTLSHVLLKLDKLVTIEDIEAVARKEIKKQNIESKKFADLTEEQKAIAERAMNCKLVMGTLDANAREARQNHIQHRVLQIGERNNPDQVVKVEDVWKLVLPIYWNEINSSATISLIDITVNNRVFNFPINNRTSMYLNCLCVFLLETIINPIIPCEDEDEDEDEDKDSKFVKYCKTETANKVESIVSILYDILLNKKDVITDYDRALLHTKTGLTVEQWELKEKEKEKEEKDDPGTTRYNLRGFLSKSTPNYQINKTCSLIIELLKLAPTIKEDRGKTEELKKLLNKLKEDLRKFGCEENLTIHDL